MADILLLLGTGLCILSFPAAIVAVLRTHPPRSAAILFTAGILALAVCAWAYPGSVGFSQLGPAFGRLFG